MGAQYVRDTYRVPARRGGRIRFTWSGWHGAQEGTIISFPGAYIKVRMDSGEVFRLHPTWEVEYLPSRPVPSEPHPESKESEHG